ncbi:MAG: 50S ribosomal protein L18 [Candidatus Portnoybacteria bacterium CG10_big_fil_rev_8_21_14_0_10_44_7]|uniref:Large ribosomal subunit protein uL18 n=1 Tax=Candidatus Portnoybacteria bacterium CG10_big_fil_rev_8_21_14_0_10_44_7 TaxID=1974816 RepID=A0A2M8KIK0_9BACT|nr:MAG: 50S ribosomal protein L18 [Candidatus Portnoybacteria bacterium CG10_big_fil_rev_8_21_14_0_10_44_7]
MEKKLNKKENRQRRAGRVRSRILGTAQRPRLSVFRSNRAIFLQLIDDQRGQTLVAASDAKMKGKNKMQRAQMVGAELAKLAQAKKIKQVVFDRGGYRFHGRVKAAAEGARQGGLVF